MAECVGININLKPHCDFHSHFNICAEKMTELTVDDFIFLVSFNFFHTFNNVMNQPVALLSVHYFSVEKSGLGLMIFIGFKRDVLAKIHFVLTKRGILVTCKR